MSLRTDPVPSSNGLTKQLEQQKGDCAMVHPTLCAQLARQRQHDLWREGAQARLARQAPPAHATPDPRAARAPADGRAWLARLPLV
jgi:hypothetical protein